MKKPVIIQNQLNDKKKKELARQKKTNKKDEMNLQLMIESYDDKVNTNDSQCAAKTNHK